jgi:hypothetical protein
MINSEKCAITVTVQLSALFPTPYDFTSFCISACSGYLLHDVIRELAAKPVKLVRIDREALFGAKHCLLR